MTYIHIQRDIPIDKDIGPNNLIVQRHTRAYMFDLPYKSLNSFHAFSCNSPHIR